MGKTRTAILYDLKTSGLATRKLDYVLTDHLGSWNKVMNQNKVIVQQTHFDPWGNFIEWKTESGKRKTSPTTLQKKKNQTVQWEPA
jgi:hypothetical protein